MPEDIYTYKYNDDQDHVGVVVFEKEYFYSAEGVQIIEPGSWTDSGPTEKIHEGSTDRTQRAFENYLERPDFSSYSYNSITHNCRHFARLVVKYLKKEFRVAEEALSVFSVVNPLAPALFALRQLSGSSNTK